MKYRLAEGSGECFYYLGVEDDGYPRGLEPQDLQVSVSTLNIMAGQVCVVWGGVDACMVQGGVDGGKLTPPCGVGRCGWCGEACMVQGGVDGVDITCPPPTNLQ